MLTLIRSIPGHLDCAIRWGGAPNGGPALQRITLLRRAVEPMAGHEMYSYAGNKFQELMTQKVNPSDHGQTYYNVIRAKLGTHTILHSYQADCVNHDVIGEPKIDDFIELKTSNDNQDKYCPSFQFWDGFKRTKSRRWWSQMVMTGIKNFVVGIRYCPGSEPDSVHCDMIERLTIHDIKQCASGWSPIVAMDTLNRFLNYVKTVVMEDNLHVAYLFKINKCEFRQFRHGPIVISGTEFTHETFDIPPSSTTDVDDNQYNQYLVISKSMITKLDSVDNNNNPDQDILESPGHCYIPNRNSLPTTYLMEMSALRVNASVPDLDGLNCG